MDYISLFNAAIGIKNYEYNLHQYEHTKQLDIQIAELNEKLDKILILLERRNDNDS